jgi:hypothetical protein
MLLPLALWYELVSGVTDLTLTRRKVRLSGLRGDLTMVLVGETIGRPKDLGDAVGRSISSVIITMIYVDV